MLGSSCQCTREAAGWEAVVYDEVKFSAPPPPPRAAQASRVFRLGPATKTAVITSLLVLFMSPALMFSHQYTTVSFTRGRKHPNLFERHPCYLSSPGRYWNDQRKVQRHPARCYSRVKNMDHRDLTGVRVKSYPSVFYLHLVSINQKWSLKAFYYHFGALSNVLLCFSIRGEWVCNCHNWLHSSKMDVHECPS